MQRSYLTGCCCCPLKAFLFGGYGEKNNLYHQFVTRYGCDYVCGVGVRLFNAKDTLAQFHFFLPNQYNQLPLANDDKI
jgi:hypothetical protein